jgi:Bacterial capsule synthesis protein PGA_cap
MRHPVCWLLLTGCLSLTGFEARASTLTFADACAEGERISVAAAGDLLFHHALQAQALADGGSYRQFWRSVEPLIRNADIAYANLEGTVAPDVDRDGERVSDPGRRIDGRVYGRATGALYYNYHPSLVGDLRASGFDVLSTANNHAMDRGSLGASRTIDALAGAGMALTGTRKRGEASRPWHAVTWSKGMSVAWLACSMDTNENPDPHAQVLLCEGQQSVVLAELARLAADPLIDAVILTPHWGQEGDKLPDKRQRVLARAAIAAGAAAVIGTHPHVVQPWEKIVTANGREGLVIYSTGNFVSNQRSSRQRTGTIVMLELLREPGRKARVSAAGYVPTWVHKAGNDTKDEKGHRVVENRDLDGDAQTGLRQSLAVLPEGNRLAMDAADQLPRTCTMANPAQIALRR